MKTKYVFFTGAGLFLLGIVAAMAKLEDAAYLGILIGGFTMVLIFPVALAIEACVRYRELEEKRKAKLERIREERKRRDEEWRQRELERPDPNRIVEVKYLGIGTTRQKRGGLGGALVGGFFGGLIGAVVGAVIPKNEEGLHRFAVKYADGRVKIKDVHPNSWEYKELMKYVKWEDLS